MPGEGGTSNIESMIGKEISLSLDDANRAWQFAMRIGLTKKGYYNQDISKVISDFYAGTLAEIAVSKLLKPFGCSDADLNDRTYGSRFEPDLTLPEGKVSVKCCYRPFKGEWSYTFQDKRYGKPADPIFKNAGAPNYYVVCVKVDIPSITCTLHDIKKATFVLEHARFRDGVDLPRFKGDKVFYHPED
jgi:hypothetical protein